MAPLPFHLQSEKEGNVQWGPNRPKRIGFKPFRRTRASGALTISPTFGRTRADKVVVEGANRR